MAKTVRLYYLFRGLSSAFLFKVFLVFYYLECGLSFAQIGVLGSIFAATVIVFEVPTGMWADRFGRRLTMGYGALLMSIASFGYYFVQGFYTFILLEFLLALGLTLTSGADSAFLYDALKKAGKESRYAELEGKAGFAKHSGMALSALFGGFIAMVDLKLLFPTTAILIFLAFIVTRIMDKIIPYSITPKTSEPWKIKKSLSFLKGHKAIWWTLFYSSIVFILIRVSDTLLQPLMKQNGFAYWKIGLVAALGSLVAAFAAKSTASVIKRFSEYKLLWFIPTVLVLSFTLFTLGTGVILGLILLANLGVQGFYSPFTKTLLNRRISNSSLRATILSFESSVKRLMLVLIMPVIGIIVDNYGIKGGLIFCIVISIISIFILIITFPHKKRGSNIRKKGYKTPAFDPGISSEEVVTDRVIIFEAEN
jgi:MFS family permease